MRPAVLNVLLAISPSTVLGRTLKDFKDLKDGEIIPGRYLVEFEDTQSTFQENVKAQKLLAGAPLVTISSSLFNGASYQFDDSQLDNDGISTLSSLPSVKNIWPVRAFKVPDDEIHWTGENPSAQVSTTSDSKKNTTGYSPHVLTQVDRLQAEGLTGKGIKVGIIDTGIDYKHPALGGCFGPNCLVSHGYDYIGEGNANYGEPDDDPYTECQGHGTHVAGIVAAQQNKYGFLGAAPGVKLGMYRVFDCNGYTGSDLIVAGMLRAFEDGNHIVSASLGGPGGWAEHPMAVVADRLAAEGVICTFAAGNSGVNGPFNSETPGTASSAIAVASVDNLELGRVFSNASYTVGNATTKPFGWTQGTPSKWGNVSLPLYVGNGDGSGSFSLCDEFTNATDLSGYLVLIKSVNTCGDWYKFDFARQKGAKHVLFYSEGTEATAIKEIFIDTEDQEAGVGMIDESTAAELIGLSKSGKRVVLNMIDPKFAGQYVDTTTVVGGGYMSVYSSWGPTWELDIKPEIAAPGRNILSTWIQPQGGYAVISGTSMATPLVAGILALMLEARGKLSPMEARQLLSSTAKPLTTFENGAATPDLAPVHLQGSGLAQAWNAVHATGVTNIVKFALNDTDHFAGSQKFTLKNTGTEDVTYTLANQGALVAYTLNPGSNFLVPAAELEYVSRSAEVKFAESSVKVAAGQEVVVSFEVTAPSALSARRLPIYSGFIKLDGSNGDKMSLPYLGMAGSMRSATVLDGVKVQRSDRSPTDPNNIATEFIMYKFPNGTHYNVYPRAFTFQALGSTHLDIQIHAVNSGTNGTTNLGSLPYYPVRYVPSEPYGMLDNWSVRLKNDSWAPEGDYVFVATAERIFGNGEKQVIRSSPFKITYGDA